MTEDYRRALEAAVQEYEALGLKRREVDQRLAEVAQTIGTLSRLCGLTPTVPMGLTNAIRLVVRGAGQPMTPIDVRDRLRAIGFDVTKYTNELAAVHTILRRLNDSGELLFIPRAAGKHQYTWNHPSSLGAMNPDIIAAMRDATGEREAMLATDDDIERKRSGAAVPRPRPKSRESRARSGRAKRTTR
jgi:hypothetical protein